MLNKVTLFLMLYGVWMLSLFFAKQFNLIFITLGFGFCLLIVALVFRLGIFSRDTEFLFLQITFYKYLFIKINNNIMNVYKICMGFLDKNTEYTPLLDYVFLNKDSDTEASFTANLLILMPGTIGILMKKRYLIVQSLDKQYFSLVDMYNITNEVNKLNDDSLI